MKEFVKKNMKNTFPKGRNLGDSNPLPIKISTFYSALSERQSKKGQPKISNQWDSNPTKRTSIKFVTQSLDFLIALS